MSKTALTSLAALAMLLAAPAAEALLSSASELGLVGVEGGASVKDKLAREDAKLTDERYRDVDWLDREA